MTAMQLNAEIYRTMGVIAEDEGLLRQAMTYEVIIYEQAYGHYNNK